jgi:hypothetical protein
MAIARLNHSVPQGDEPNRNKTETQEQSPNTVCLFQLADFQVKSMSLHIVVYLFPHMR